MHLKDVISPQKRALSGDTIESLGIGSFLQMPDAMLIKICGDIFDHAHVINYDEYL
jgi:hypothetical protein